MSAHRGRRRAGARISLSAVADGYRANEAHDLQCRGVSEPALPVSETETRMRGWTWPLSNVAVRIAVGWVLAVLASDIWRTNKFSQPNTWNPFEKWDAVHYLAIANMGYTQVQTPFFPLYPLILRVLHLVTFSSVSYSALGLVASWAGFAGCAIVIRSFMTELGDGALADFSMLLLIWSPASVFFLSDYNISLLLLLTLVSCRFLQQDRLVPAAAAASLASITHPLGIGVVVAVLVAVVVKRRLLQSALVGAIAVSGIVAWCSWQLATYGNAFSFLTEQSKYFKTTELPFLATFQALSEVFTVSATGPFEHNNLFIFQIETLASVVSIAVIAYFVVDLCRRGRRRFPIWLSSLVIYQVVVASTLVRVFNPITSAYDIGHRVTLTIPLSEIRWDFTSVGLLVAATALVRRWPRLRDPLLMASAGSAIFLQSLFAAGWRFF